MQHLILLGNLERSKPVEGKLDSGIGVFFGTLADSGRRVVNPYPAAHGVRGRKAKGVHDQVVAAGQT